MKPDQNRVTIKITRGSIMNVALNEVYNALDDEKRNMGRRIERQTDL